MVVYPNYQNGSIVNLMSSIADKFGVKTQYNPLERLKFDNSTNSVLLMVMDGLGYEIINKIGKNSFLKKLMDGNITSVFPSTTSASLTTFGTGVAPQQHAITGWFVYLKEIGVLSKVLPFTPRYGGEPFSASGIDPSIIFERPAFCDALPVDSYYVTRDVFACADFTRSVAGNAHVIPYSSLDGFFAGIKSAVSMSNLPKYIYAYWPYFDTLGHANGVAHKDTIKHFWELDAKVESLFMELAGSNISVIITADHGMVDVGMETTLLLSDHAPLKSAMTMPLSGEARGPYFFVRPSMEEKFLKYVEDELSYCCDIVPSNELIESGIYGLGAPNPKLFDRIGDYVLLMHEKHVLLDSIPGEDPYRMIGYHGGLSKEEMNVPLIHTTL